MIILQEGTRKNAAAPRDPRIEHIDEWQSLADKKREDALGPNYFENAKTFFQLKDQPQAPRFRPGVQIPELQVMCMREANDLSEYQPKAYIYSHKRNERVQTIEQGFQSQWDSMFVVYHLLFAQMWAQFCGTGFLQYGIDPYARGGRGQMWSYARNPATVHTDPAADYRCNWSYVILEDWVHLDEMKRQFPERARFLPETPTNVAKGGGRPDDTSSGFKLPPGPFQAMPPFNGIMNARGGVTRRRTTYCLDYSRELIGELPTIGDNGRASYRWQYPRGRVMVDCEGVVLADGANPYRGFPIVPVWATPPLYGTWAVPPPRYSENLQALAEKFYSQTYENFYRMNNGVWMIPVTAQIASGKFGGIPGELCYYEGNQPPTCVTPPAFPASSLQFPEKLLEKQRQLQGNTQARQGNPGDGNISPELFDAAVLRSQGMTQLRGRLGSAAVLEFSKQVTFAMMEYLPDQKMPVKIDGGFQVVDYKRPADHDLDDFEMTLDDGSFHMKSQAVVSKLAEALMTKGVIPVAEGLKMIGYPDAAKVGEAQQTQAALAATTAVLTGKPGKK